MGYLNIFDKVKTSSLTNKSSKRLVSVRVLDIILDETHPDFETYGGPDAIGTIFYTIISEETSLESSKNALHAKPLFSFIKNYPLKNEIVLILSTIDKGIYNLKGETSYYFPSVNIWNHPHHNALPSIKELNIRKVKNDYDIDTESGIIAREITDEGTDINLGQYFTENLKTKPLLPYEGDTILEGRFGNSIRLGSTNFNKNISIKNPWSLSDTSQTGDPIIIIRNGQDIEEDNKGWIHTLENINRDPSSIYLTSNQQISNLNVSSFNLSSYKAIIEESNTFDPIKFEGLKEEKGTTIITQPEITALPGEEEPVLNSPTNISDVESNTSTIDDVQNSKESDFYDSNETEEVPGEVNNLGNEDLDNLDLDELMG